MDWHDIAGLRLAFQPPRVAIYPAGSDFGPRVQTKLQFVWMIEGGAVWTVDGVAHEAPEGSVFLSRPGMREHFRWDPQRRTRHGWVEYSIQGANVGLPARESWPMVRLPGPGDVIPALLDHMAWLCQKQRPGWHVLAESALRHVFLAFISDATASVGSADAPSNPLVVTVLNRLRQGGVVNPTELAQAAGVSLGHLHRVFRAEVGVTPMVALRLLRLDQAAHLLARTNLSIADVAEECGFANPFHFSRCFRAGYGQAPRDFRTGIIAGGHVPPMRLVRHGRLIERLRG